MIKKGYIMRLFIGNLSYDTTEATLKEKFGADEVTIPTNDQGRPKGFAFVNVADDEKAKELIATMDKSDLDGRTIAVSEARPREDRSGGYNRGNDRNSGGGHGNWNR
jgi:RNA recognition motif-containing protein